MSYLSIAQILNKVTENDVELNLTRYCCSSGLLLQLRFLT